MQVGAIFIKATYFYICILWVCDHKSEHNRFRYIFKLQVVSDKYVGRLGLAIVPWHRHPILQTQVLPLKNNKKINKNSQSYLILDSFAPNGHVKNCPSMNGH